MNSHIINLGVTEHIETSDPGVLAQYDATNYSFLHISAELWGQCWPASCPTSSSGQLPHERWIHFTSTTTTPTVTAAAPSHRIRTAPRVQTRTSDLEVLIHIASSQQPAPVHMSDCGSSKPGGRYRRQRADKSPNVSGLDRLQTSGFNPSDPLNREGEKNKLKATLLLFWNLWLRLTSQKLFL